MPKIDVKNKYKAKEMFFRYHSVADIARKLEITRASVDQWVYGRKGRKGWLVERKLAEDKAIQLEVEENSKKRRELIRISLEFTQIALLERLKKKDEKGKIIPPTVFEAHMVTKMATDWDKLNRLAAGTPTEILDTQGQIDVKLNQAKAITIVELRDAFMRDPPEKTGDQVNEPSIEVESRRIQDKTDSNES